MPARARVVICDRVFLAQRWGYGSFSSIPPHQVRYILCGSACIRYQPKHRRATNGADLSGGLAPFSGDSSPPVRSVRASSAPLSQSPRGLAPRLTTVVSAPPNPRTHSCVGGLPTRGSVIPWSRSLSSAAWSACQSCPRSSMLPSTSCAPRDCAGSWRTPWSGRTCPCSRTSSASLTGSRRPPPCPVASPPSSRAAGTRGNDAPHAGVV